MESLSYVTLKTANQAREAEEQRTEQRKRNLLVLVLHHLVDAGYIESAKALESEGNLSFSRFEVCDNIDLPTILMEYESYYYVKFGKYPKITKKLSSGDIPQQKGGSGRRNRKGSTPSLPKIPHVPEPRDQVSSGNSASRRRPTSSNPAMRKQQSIERKPKPEVNGKPQQVNGNIDPLSDLAVSGSTVASPKGNDADGHRGNSGKLPPRRGPIIDMRAMLNNAVKGATQEYLTDSDPSERLLKPLGGYAGYSLEWRELAQSISKDIYLNNPNVRWDDIIGLDAAKRLVKESVVYPIKYPQLFTGILSPWKGLLLYGPPGTGKTLLAKAVATECNTTFFNISASSIVSKWRGDSEKLVRVLFELARFHAPSTIFLDELESLMSQRGSLAGGEHEGSRRMKTELLVQMDGLAKSDDLVFLLAASNLPWELDHAMLRRLEKRILVDLPTTEAREKMIEFHLPLVLNPDCVLSIKTNLDYIDLAEKTEGYSGSDLKLVCKEAAMRPVRKVFDILESAQIEDESIPEFSIDPITTEDVEAVLKHTKPSARMLQKKYMEWQKEYESV
ncbi:katanin p60 ATPase-containing subunit A-like 2 isoform X4 [Anneissia japonica]|uniref:katanin p60 ATPase-containing subunit A-like 2 isoform X3 n=1 Tax=Anneissia japonica TaxID=1529436 RepID=UPI0014258DE2|nr:katanin p60 ATPase-containing subunit A-like 2 isoform X3 [Anneissia japonica]XP_033108632.1 katanin p60 ATPase-containing subunit A-like 2 isoform X4 [Anneissia japonica]